MNGLIIVSHSPKLSDAISELIKKMVPGNDNLVIRSASGTGDGFFGTNPNKITTTVKEMVDHPDIDQVYIVAGLGSSNMSSQTAIDFLDPDEREKTTFINGPLAESAYVVAVQSSIGASKERILAEVDHLINNYPKLSKE